MAGESRGAGRGDDPTWWSAGSVPDDLPSWARRGLSESPSEQLTPSAAIAPRPHRRSPAPSRLRGWGLAVASVAAAAAAVPLAISTLAASHDATALPRVGTFPVVSPGSLAPGAPGVVTRTPGATAPADAGSLPALEDPTVVAAPPPRTVVAPRAVTRAAPTTTVRATPSPTADDAPTEVDATPASGPADDGDDTPGRNQQNGGGGGGNAGGGADNGTPAQQPSRSTQPNLVDRVDRVVDGVAGAVTSVGR